MAVSMCHGGSIPSKSITRFREWSRGKKKIWSSLAYVRILRAAMMRFFARWSRNLRLRGIFCGFFCGQLGLRFRDVWLGAEIGVRCADMPGRTGRVNSMVAFLILA